MARMRAQLSCGTFKDKIWESHERIIDFLTSAIRFYLELKKDPHGPETALFVGNMPPNLSQRQYEDSLLELLEDSEGEEGILTLRLIGLGGQTGLDL